MNPRAHESGAHYAYNGKSNATAKSQHKSRKRSPRPVGTRTALAQTKGHRLASLPVWPLGPQGDRSRSAVIGTLG